jgi:hypothetical protein
LRAAWFGGRAAERSEQRGTTALMPLCASPRLRPSAAAMRAIMSGVRNCITDETRLVAMANPPPIFDFALNLSGHP